jgi:hypothetical protein
MRKRRSNRGDPGVVRGVIFFRPYSWLWPGCGPGDSSAGGGDYCEDALNVWRGTIAYGKKYEKNVYPLLLGLVAFATGAILSYLIEGKIAWIPALGPATGVTIAAFFSLDLQIYQSFLQNIFHNMPKSLYIMQSTSYMYSYETEDPCNEQHSCCRYCCHRNLRWHGQRLFDIQAVYQR